MTTPKDKDPGLALDVVLPVLNEERALPGTVATLRDFLAKKLTVSWRITVADNGSTDSTLAVAQRLAEEHPEVRVVHVPEAGRGRALKRIWLESDAQILSYMDVDLSADLAGFPPLVEAVGGGGYDIAIGSRLAPGARVQRSLRRRVISWSYVAVVKALFWNRFTDAQCGFKAITRQAAQAILPHVQDPGWFFDTELLLIAEKSGFLIRELPVVWTEDPDSRVKVIKTALLDLRGLLRLRLGGVPRPTW